MTTTAQLTEHRENRHTHESSMCVRLRLSGYSVRRDTWIGCLTWVMAADATESLTIVSSGYRSPPPTRVTYCLRAVSGKTIVILVDKLVAPPTVVPERKTGGAARVDVGNTNKGAFYKLPKRADRAKSVRFETMALEYLFRDNSAPRFTQSTVRLGSNGRQAHSLLEDLPRQLRLPSIQPAS